MFRASIPLVAVVVAAALSIGFCGFVPSGVAGRGGPVHGGYRDGSLAARSRGSDTDRRRAHHSRPKAAQTSNCLIRTPFLRHLSRRVVRVEIGQKPGVVRGTGSSNPSPSSGESAANLL